MEEKTVFLVFEKYDGLIALGSCYKKVIENLYSQGYLYSNFTIVADTTMKELNLSKEVIEEWNIDTFNDFFENTKEASFYMRKEKYC